MAHRVRDIQHSIVCHSRKNVPKKLLGRKQIKFAKKWAEDSATGKLN